MSDEEYQALFETALDALRDVIAETEPGTGMALHRAFNEIKAAAGGDAANAAPVAPDADVTPARDWAAEVERDRERKRAWRAAPLALREHIVLEALGDQRMSVWELRVHLYRTRLDVVVTEEALRKLLRRLVDAGELHEVTEFPPPRAPGEPRRCGGGTRRRRVYFRNAELSGPIADLNRAFHSTCDGEAS